MGKNTQIKGLTGVRGVAALWVVFYHIVYNAEALGLSSISDLPILRDGWRGVDLFFILSGFVLMYAHEKDFVTLNAEATLRFARLRFFRVYPLNMVVLLIIALLVLCDPSFVAWYKEQRNSPDDFTFPAFVKTLFLATRWFVPIRGEWNEPVWSLSAEIVGYCAFPVIAWFLSKSQSVHAALAVAFASLIALTIALIVVGKIDGNAMGRFSIVRMAGSFMAGAALCRAWRLMPPLQRSWPSSWLTICSCLGLLISCVVPHAGILALFSLAGLVFGLASQQSLISRFLGSQPLVFLGRISFPLYLVHVTLLHWWTYRLKLTGLDAIISVLIYIVVCIVTAAILNRTVERPAHAFGRWWAGRSVISARAAANLR